MNFRLLLILFAALLSCFSSGAAPFISSFSPAYGSSSDPTYIHIYGSGFYPGTLVVKFNGVQDTSAAATMADGTVIQAHVPAGAPLGANPIFVSVNGASTTSGSQKFTVIGSGPYIASFSPPAGDAGTPVTITGAHFVGSGGSVTITFNGVTAPVPTSRTETEIVVNAPSGVTSGPITVTRSGAGSSTSASNFYVTPAVSSFSPASGRTGTNVTIRGVNFTNATAVMFNNTAAVQFWVTNNTTLGAVAPTNVATGPIHVETPAGNFVPSSINFVVPPTIYGFSPNHGSPGTVVTVTGANFDASGLSVKFGGVSAAPPSSVAFGSFNVTVPNGATNAPITVTTVDGTMISTQLFYLPPRLMSFTPTNAPAGSSVQISGTNLIGTSSVTFYGVSPVPTVNLTNNTKMSVIVPSGVITGPLTVTTPAGSSNSGNLYFCGAPAINSINPTHGVGGAVVTIVGTNFLFASSVSFNGASSSFTILNNGSITATTPTNAVSGPITVTGPAGSAASGIFTVDYSSDLAVGITDSPDPVFVGSNLVYTISVTNFGPTSATNVLLSDTLLAGSTNLGILSSGGKTVVTLKTVPLIPGSVANTVSVTSGNLDSNPGDNSSTINTTVWPIPVLAITPLANQFQISWPAPLSNFTLQFNCDLSNTGGWSNITNKPIISGGQSLLIRTNTRTNNIFFRLKN